MPSQSSRDLRGVLDGNVSRVIAFGLTVLLLFCALRALLLGLYLEELHGLSAGELLNVLFTGLRLDGVVVGYMLVPAALLLFLPRFLGQRALRLYSVAFLCLLSFGAVAEFRFFDYYGFRPNYLVLEHGSDIEIIRTVIARYTTPLAILMVVLLTLLSLFLQRRLAALLARLPARLTTRTHRAYGWLTPLALLALAVLMGRGSLDHRPLNPSAAAVTADRRANEIAGSGMLNVTYELVQRAQGKYVDLESVQSPLPRAEAIARVQRLLSSSGRFTHDSPNPFVRLVSYAESSERPLNVVVVVMESFTGRLVGVLGGHPALSPELDALAAEGLLLTHCYATGERTVQGLEAVVSSFPPLPGVSVVRRPETRQGFATLASVLGERGYDSLFLYGGQGIFDHMRGFFLGNGFRAFIEKGDFRNVSFLGSWGVSDGDLFRRANREFQRRWDERRPFIATLLTTSLHSPWEFPKDGVPPLPPGTSVPPGFKRDELANFLYADFAVGEFIREARKLPYFADTLFVFVADHGVHLRGRELLPSEEYRVPALFLAPGWVAPARIDTVTSQLDIGPTILGIIGGEHRSPFFGRDVHTAQNAEGLAILIYNKRHYGVRRADRLIVLGEGGRQGAYRLGSNGGLAPVEPSPAHEEDVRDALAVVQVAEELMESGRFTTVREAELVPRKLHSARLRSAP